MAWQGASVISGLNLGAEVFNTEQTNEAAAKEAEKNRRFQERMSNSAYQRAAADLEAAGLNRILAVGSPASVPSGNAAPVVPADLSRVVSNGVSVATARQQIAQSQAQTNLLDEQEKTEGLRQELTRQQAEQARTQAISNAESARKTSLEADRAEVFNPVVKAAGDAVDWAVDKGKSAARDFDDSAIKRQIDEVIDRVTNRARNVPRNDKGIERGSFRERADSWFHSR